MSPSMLCVLLIALLVCTPGANAIKCRLLAAGLNEQAVDCGSRVTSCATQNTPLGIMRGCAKGNKCNQDGATCCNTDLCNHENGPPPSANEAGSDHLFTTIAVALATLSV